MGFASVGAGIFGGEIKEYVTLKTDGSIDYILFKHIKNGSAVEQKRVSVYETSSDSPITFQFLSVYYNGNDWVLSVSENTIGQTKNSANMTYAASGNTIKTWSYYTQIDDVFCQVDKKTTVLALRNLLESA